MDFVDRLASFGNPWRNANPASLLKFTELDPQVQGHLAKVYVTLFGCLALTAAGCALGLYTSFIMPFTQLIAFGCVLGLAFTPDAPANTNKRYAMLGGFSFAQGCALTPLVALASTAYPGVVLTAILSTAAVFLCFTASALMTRRRTYMFLGGYLSSAIIAMFVLRMCSWMMRSNFGFEMELYGGILVFSGYILFDTQLIVEKAYAGQLDHIRHAQDLLVDLLALFVRILVVIIKNAQKKQQEEERRRRNKRD